MKRTIEDFNTIEPVKPVIARKFYKADNAEMIQMRLQNKEEIKKHSVDWDAVFILQKGTLHFTENDNEHIIKADDFIVSKRGTEHGFINNNDGEAVLLVIKLK